MQLKLIPHTTCPTCGAITIAESCEHRHLCGEGFEIRRFACGCVLSWSPNFSRLEVDAPCSKHPDQIKKVKRRKQFKQDLTRFVELADVDDDVKEKCRIYLYSLC